MKVYITYQITNNEYFLCHITTDLNNAEETFNCLWRPQFLNNKQSGCSSLILLEAEVEGTEHDLILKCVDRHGTMLLELIEQDPQSRIIYCIQNDI